MRKEHLLTILFFGTLWGVAEASLGGAMYSANVRYAAVPLAIVAFTVLTAARVYLPQTGSATLIAGCAMLYKLVNAPFFPCHFLGILALGLAYDVGWSVLRTKNRSLFAAAATYLGFALFALTITYVFRYPHWVAGGLPKVLHHVGISGTMAAAGNAIFVPMIIRLARNLRAKAASSVKFRPRLAAGGLSVITAAMWILRATVSF